MSQLARIPIHEDFESSGIVAALRRQETWILENCAYLVQSSDRGSWLTDVYTTQYVENATLLRALRTFRRARVVFDCAASNDSLPPPPVDEGVDVSAFPNGKLVAMTRLVFGDMCESVVRMRAATICACDELPVEPVAKKTMARLMLDGYLVATWTSAHVEYLDSELYVRKTETKCNVTSQTCEAPRVSLQSVPYAITSLPDLSSLFEHRVPCKGTSKFAAAMISVLTRCTNAGSRGWESTLTDALADGEGCLRILSHVMAAAFTGMHPMLHPMNRPPWEERLKLYRIHRSLDARTLISKSGTASKEAVRMYAAVLLANLPATREAMNAASHPAGQLVVSPFELPPCALVAAMTLMLKAARRESAMPSIQEAKHVAVALRESLGEEQRKRKGSKGTKMLPVPIFYSNSWLGRSQPLSVRGQKLTDTVNQVFFQSFRSEFLPMWHYNNASGHRVSRMDCAQHKELHSKNPLLQLCKALDDDASLYAQRKALCDHRFGIVTVAQGAEAINVTLPPSQGRAAPNLTELGARDAARLFTLGRASALAAQLLTYNLGDRTANMQINAVAQRLLAPRKESESIQEVVKRLPKTATHIMICVECRRVANACQNGSGKDLAHNEIGISSSMLRVDGKLEDGHMRCAKRSSAALRTALQLEEESRCGCSIADTSTAVVVHDTAGMVSRLRRDQKAVFDQVGAAVACGDQPLVSVPIVGRVVCVFNQFYSLCSYCGCLCTVEQHNRYGAEICCLRCDVALLHRDRKIPVKDNSSSTIRCRYCGRQDQRSNNRFKILPSPRDSVGSNSELPPPLRWVSFCPQHWRPWLPAALDVLSMREIFAHISQKCRPIFTAATHRLLECPGGRSNSQNAAPARSARVQTRVFKKNASGRTTIARQRRKPK